MTSYRDAAEREPLVIDLLRNPLPADLTKTQGLAVTGVAIGCLLVALVTLERAAFTPAVIAIAIATLSVTVLLTWMNGSRDSRLEIHHDRAILARGEKRLELPYDEVELDAVGDETLVLRRGHDRHTLHVSFFAGGRKELLSTFAHLRAAHHAHRHRPPPPGLRVAKDERSVEEPGHAAVPESADSDTRDS